MTLLYIVTFKISENKKAYTQEQWDEYSADPFFFNGGIEVDIARFVKDSAAREWLAKNGITYSSQ